MAQICLESLDVQDSECRTLVMPNAEISATFASFSSRIKNMCYVILYSSIVNHQVVAYTIPSHDM